MAVPQGGYDPASAAGTGAYSYLADTSQPQYFAGTFMIDTGYDDPVLWTTGVDCAEVYGARVYANTSTVAGSYSAATFLGEWFCIATPVWSAKHWVLPHSNTQNQRRVLIAVDVYLTDPVAIAAGNWQRLDSVNWSLYRI